MNQRSPISKLAGVALVLSTLLIARPVPATITGPIQITSVSQLDLTGDITIAQDTGGSGATVLGVPFAAGTYFNGTVNNLALGTGGTDNAGLNTVLTTYNAQHTTLSATLPMPVGHAYKLQLLFSDIIDRPSHTGSNDLVTVDGQSVFLPTGGSSLDYLITATGTAAPGGIVVSIANQAGDYGILNGFTLEDTIPEPSSVVLLGLGGLLLWRKLRR